MKKKFKSILIMCMIIFAVLCILQTKSYAGGLNDEQRKKVTAYVVDMLEQGSQKNIFRYTQGAQRTSVFNWQTVSTSAKQITPSTAYLSVANVPALEALLKAQTGRDITVKPGAYSCTFKGADIKGAMGTDCSAFCSAVYHLTCGTSFQYTSGLFRNGPFTRVSVSEAKPGDVLWKEGHVAIYLGDYKGNGVKYMAHASSFLKNQTQLRGTMSQLLFEFLMAHPTSIHEHPQYNSKQAIVLQVPESGIRDPNKQVLIAPLSHVAFTCAYSYTGEVKPGKQVDFSNIAALGSSPSLDGTTQNGEGETQNNSSDQSNQNVGDLLTGVDNALLTFPGNKISWPSNLNLLDETLATSKGYFYKGTPTYGEYKGTQQVFDWLISIPGNVMDWIISTIVYVLKAEFIGWTAIIENVISTMLNFGIDDVSANAQALQNLTEIDTIEKSLNTSESVLLGVKALSRGNINRENTPVAELADNATNATGTVNKSEASKVEKDSSLFQSDAKKVISIEDVIFNRVPLLDIDFFNFTEAGGQKLSKGSLLYTIRENIASWYNTLRLVCIMGMLVALLYVVIKIIFSNIASEKAEYKNKLKDWLVGFIIVMSIHYAMIAVITINNQIVKILDPIASNHTAVDVPDVKTNNTNLSINKDENGQVSLYEAIKIQAYDVNPATGLAATVLYMVLVFLLIRFVVLYARRLFTLAILTVISPVIGVMYAVNTKQAPLKSWLEEYMYNVLIQFFHAVIYTALVSVAFSLTKVSTFKAAILAFIFMGFIFSAEEIIKKIFGVSKAKSLSTLSNSALAQVAMYTAGKKIFDKSLGVAAKITKKSEGFVKNRILAPATERAEKSYFAQMQNNNQEQSKDGAREKAEEYSEESPLERKERLGEKILHNADYKPDTVMLNGREYLLGKQEYDKNGKTKPRVPYGVYIKGKGTKGEGYFTYGGFVNEKIAEKRNEEYEARKAYATQRVNDAKDTFLGLAAVYAAIPMLVLNFSSGVGLSIYGISRLNRGLGRKKIDGVKKITGVKKPNSRLKLTGKRLVFAWATCGLSKGIDNIRKNSADTEEALHTKYTEEIKVLKSARELEDKIGHKLVNINIETIDPDTLQEKFEDGTLERAALMETMAYPKAKDKEQRLKDIATQIDYRRFEKSINVTVEKIDPKDIERIIDNYIIKKDIIDFTDKDINAIVVEINKDLKEKNKDIRVTKELSDAIKSEIKKRAIVILSNKENVDENRDNTEKSTEKNNGNNKENNADNIFEEDNPIKENGNNTADVISDLKSTREKVDKTSKKTKKYNKDTFDNSDNYNSDTTSDVTNTTANTINVSNASENSIYDEYLQQMGRNDMIDVIAEALQEKQSIDREITSDKYKKVAEDVKELIELNEKYKELTGTPIYELVDKKTGLPYENPVAEVVKRMKTYIDERMK